MLSQTVKAVVAGGDRIAPKTVEKLQEAIREAHVAGEALVIEGGNTLGGMGRAPSRTCRTLCTTGLRKIHSYSFADLTISVGAGMTLRALRAALSEHEQFVPLDAPCSQRATVGGTLAAGWLGPRRHLYGRPRDYVIGTQIVLADGTVANAGGMVVKNVTGYDMSKLYVGSFGTLGVLTSVNFKTLPAPPHARVFIAPLPENSRLRAIEAIAQLDVTPAAAFWVHGFRKAIDGDDGPDGRLFVFHEGSASLIERASRDVRTALGRAGVPETQIIDTGAQGAFDRVLDACVASIGQRSITYRVNGNLEDMESRLREMYVATNRSGLSAEALLDFMNGDLFMRISGKDAHAFCERIEPLDDALSARLSRMVIVAGDSPIRNVLNVWGRQPPALDRMRALKAAFDPNGTLNPGRFIGGI
ncbi:MAG: FAD-binding oxidoreductase [Candidatus Eremiobacteraeota bacterium]|nr:FAD-binding oxidoreductase [Candidatus Eremiobacteraeota bacterium]